MIKTIRTTKKSHKNPKIYECLKCDYITNNKKDYNKHILTQKHLKNNDDNTITPINPQKYICVNCYKQFNDRSGLWRHKKGCVHIDLLNFSDFLGNETTDNETNGIIIGEDISSDKVLHLIKQNNDYKEMIIEQNKIINELLMKMKDFNDNNDNDNERNICVNNYFNKTNMNIEDFTFSLVIEEKDIDNLLNLGITQGITNIIINHFNNTKQNERPIYIIKNVVNIKSSGLLEKDFVDNINNKGNTKLEDMIKKVIYKIIIKLNEMREIEPKYKEETSKMHDLYFCLICETLTSENKDTTKKIIKNIMKEIINTCVY